MGDIRIHASPKASVNISLESAYSLAAGEGDGQDRDLSSQPG